MANELHRVTHRSKRVTSVLLERDDAIRAAHNAGYTMRQIAKAAGLTAGRVHQIVHETRTHH